MSDRIVYKDSRYVLGESSGTPFLSVGGVSYKLTCHPYEPCLYISGKDGRLTAVHNAFDPSAVLQSFADGLPVTSITGRRYDPPAFCRMAEYAAGRVDIQIDEAEKVFDGNANRKPEQKAAAQTPADGPLPRPESGIIIEDDPFYECIAGYPDCVVDYCLVKNEHPANGYDAHRQALLRACQKLFIDEDGEAIWHFDAGKADARQIPAEELFFLPEEWRTGKACRPDASSPQVTDGGKRPYWQAFLLPPYGCPYTADDFRKVNAALFPYGTDRLEVYEWTTGWSEYFDEGREWWGTLCVTAYDPDTDRFAVILASATD